MFVLAKAVRTLDHAAHVIDRNKKKKAGNFVWSQPRTHLGR
jgi:hypothetical protein